MEITLYVILIVLLIIVIVLARKFYGTNNQLRQLTEVVKEAASNILVSMSKKAELANQLITIASQYAAHERFTHVSISQNAQIGAVMTASQQIDQTLHRIVMLATNFPALQANQTYQQLMSQLKNIEDELQGKRERYNSTVRTFNTTRNVLPVSFFASALGFKELPYFAESEMLLILQSGLTALPQPRVAALQGPVPISQANLLQGGQAQLVGLSSAVSGRSFLILDGLIIGRSSTCQLRVSDSTASREHARLRFSQGKWFIQDLESRWGTYVNGAPVQATVLTPGDRIRIGSTEFEFRI